MNGVGHLGQKLIEAKIHPYRTHIVDFADQAKSRIDFIRQGIKEQNVEVEERLQILERIWEEVQEKIKEKKISYVYWLYLHYRLSLLATPSVDRKMPNVNDNWWITEEGLIEYFTDDSQMAMGEIDGMSKFSAVIKYINKQMHWDLFKQILGIIRLFPSRIVIPVCVHVIPVCVHCSVVLIGISPLRSLTNIFQKHWCPDVNFTLFKKLS